MELRRILAVALGLALIFLSVAPYIKARELTMQTPSGWEVLGSKRLRVPTKELQEIYAPNGTPTGRYGRPIDHGWFGEGKLIEIGGTHIWVLDTYQDARGCHVRVRVENAEGELTTAGGQSQGVQWGDLRLYITWAKFPPEEGDWRTAKGEYFYGLEEFELTLYRVPTAPAIPLSAAGAVLGVGLVLFGVVVIREGERRGILPVLIGSAFLCALVVRAVGSSGVVSPIIQYARLSFLGYRLGVADSTLSKFFLVENDGRTYGVYDSSGTKLWSRQLESQYSFAYGPACFSGDGKRVLVFVKDTAYRHWAWLLDANSGEKLMSLQCLGYAKVPAVINNDGSKIAFIDPNNIVQYYVGGSPTRSFTVSEAYVDTLSMSPDGNIIVATTDIYKDGDVWAGGSLYVWDARYDTTLLYWRDYGALQTYISPSGRYILIYYRTNFPESPSGYVDRVRVYDLQQQKVVIDPFTELASYLYTVSPFSPPTYYPEKVALETVILNQNWQFSYSKIAVYTLPDASLVFSRTTSDYFLLNYGASLRMKDKIVAVGLNYSSLLQGKYDLYFYFAGSDVPSTPLLMFSSESSPPPISLGNDFFCGEDEFFLGNASYDDFSHEMPVIGWQYSLKVSCNKPLISLDGGPYKNSYQVQCDPASAHVITIDAPQEYIVTVSGNFTPLDNIKLTERRLEIYMDNNKTISVGVYNLTVTGLTVTPTVVDRWTNVTVSWSTTPDASFYELQYSTTQDFSQNVITYTQITGTSFVLQPPQEGWSTKNYVRVRASTQGVYGSWTDPVEFKSVWTPAWLTVSPKNPYPLQSVYLSWEQVPADYYEVSLDGQVIDTPTTPSYTIPAPASGWVAGQTHTVRVRTYLQGIYSDPIENTFTPRAFPSPAYLSVSPQNPQPYEDVRLEWESVPDASYYQLSLEGQIIVEQTTETTYTLSPPAGGWLYNKTYTVAVRAVNPSYGTSDWKENVFGTTVFPQPRWLNVSPSTLYELQSVSLSWEKVAQATAYDVRLDENIIASGISATSYTLTPPSGGWEKRMYTVAVRGVNPSVDGISAWTENYFEVLPFPKPSYIVVEPPNPMPNESVVVSWERVEIAKFYDVALDSKTNIIASSLTETSITLSPPGGMWSFGPHRVFVRAMDPNLGTSDWAENSFTVQVVVGLLAGPAPAPAKPARLQLAAMVPMLPHPLVSAFNVLGQIAGVYTLSLLMVLSGLVIMTVGLRRYG